MVIKLIYYNLKYNKLENADKFNKSRIYKILCIYDYDNFYIRQTGRKIEDTYDKSKRSFKLQNTDSNFM